MNSRDGGGGEGMGNEGVAAQDRPPGTSEHSDVLICIIMIL